MEKYTLHGKICVLLFFMFIFSVLNHTKALENNKTRNCRVDHSYRTRGIGSVIDQNSRSGKEQKIAIQMAVNDFNKLSTCSKLVLHITDLHGKSARAASTAIKLIKHKKVQGIVAALTLEEATDLATEFEEVASTPIITIGTAAISPSPLLPKSSSIFQLSNDIGVQMKCTAAIIGHFRWQKVTVIYEQSNSIYADARLVKQLSKALKPFNSVVERDLAFPSMSSLPEPKAFIEEELNKLRSKSSGIFVIVQSSLEFATILFEKAKKIGIMGKGHVWIVNNDIVSLIESVGPSVIQNMKGIIGFKENYKESKSFKDFSFRFRRTFKSAYPGEEHPYPSMYALRAYDATWAIAKAMQHSKGKVNSSELVNHISSSDFEGLSGEISFKNGKLWQKPTFHIINVTGKIYTEIASLSPELGFSMDLRNQERKGTRRITMMHKELDLVHCPGGVPAVLGERRLKIGVPVRAAVHKFVRVSYDQEENISSFDGFSVEVFKAAVKLLPHPFPYDFVPFYGTYDDMLHAVYNKSLNAAVADMTIVDDRFDYADFSQPYMDSQIVMVVPAKKDFKGQEFIAVTAFEWKLWVVMAVLSLSTGAIIYLNEHLNENPDFAGSFPQIIGPMLWFSVTLLSFAQRESIRNNLSRLVLAVWLFVILVMTASYTAVLSSMLTVPRLKPSILEVDYLQKTNAIVGCNGEGFIPRYLNHSLNIKQENVKKIRSISDYEEAFEKREIAAAFFISPHAKLFLATNSKRYVIAKPSLQAGGLAYVRFKSKENAFVQAFQKGSRFTSLVSKAVLNMKQTGEINNIEGRILSFSNNSPSDHQIDDLSLYLSHFSAPLIVSSMTTAIVSLIMVVRVINQRWSILDSIHSSLIHRRISRWASFLLVEKYARFGSGLFGAPIIQGQDSSTDIATEN